MHRIASAGVRHGARAGAFWAILLAQAAVLPQAKAIEMFTFFGDGSRIGLPSLEVPIEAYPGIPLRSDRLRAARNRTAAARRGGPAGESVAPGGITIRSMPTPQPVPRASNLPPAARRQPPRPSTQAVPAGQRGMRGGRTARPAPSRMPSSSQPDSSLQIPQPLAEQR